MLWQYSKKVIGCDTSCQCGGVRIIWAGETGYEQIRGSRAGYYTNPISQADRYNGVQLSGYYRLTWGAVRVWRRGEWSEWHEGTLWGLIYDPELRLYAEKKNGQWELGISSKVPGVEMTAMQCRDMPK